MDQNWIRIGLMPKSQSESDPAPSPHQAALWFRLVSKAQAMGLVQLAAGTELDRRTLRSVLHAAKLKGLLRGQQATLGELLAARASEPPPQRAIAALEGAVEAFENSPLPDTEWTAVSGILGEAVLASLVGVSASSVKRYSASEREASDEVADRLHFLAMVVADLSGSYNELGIRRWFERPRTQLGGKTPREALGRRWQSTTPTAQQVRQLAASLVASGAT